MTIRNGLTSLALFLHLYLIFVLCCCPHSTNAFAAHRSRQRHHGPRVAASTNAGDLVTARDAVDEANVTVTCVPFGECEACPDDALHEPFCQPFGNRRLMHCSPVSQFDTDASPSHTPPGSPPSRPGSQRTRNGKSATQGETPAWQSCGRIPSVERADFYEFFACNLFLALIAVLIVLVRTKLVQTRQARSVAARIWGRR